MFKNLTATDLAATRLPTSRRLLCNLAGTDRGPCCDLWDWWKLSVAERPQSGCNVCVTEALPVVKTLSFMPCKESTNYLRLCHIIITILSPKRNDTWKIFKINLKLA